ncbi:hypothetical protein M422DRAFT_24762 [Sphaerobolus stellatus SS14]|nr:hypothetical protein M422DRAFT_24762 [Sphaerobolus stellatus SS14]
MWSLKALSSLVLLSLTSSVLAINASTTACSLLNTALPGKVAFPPLSAQYISDNEHWAGSSSDFSTCSVEPSTRADVATIFQTINQTRTNWAVKGGGHAYNAGFSSTQGVLISLSQFNEITYNATTSTARIGAGNIWDDVYAALVPLGVNVVGGRVPGVGVAGFTLGGGYGWATQEFGLTIDTVVGYEMITPTGQILDVNAISHPDLFFGLRGGGNNFGIVTTFILKTHAQGQVYGGPIVYLGDIPAIRQAIVDFNANNNDPKAMILSSYTFTVVTLEVAIYIFYDGPTPPNGTFDAFLSVPAVLEDVKTRSYTDLIQSLALTPSPTRAAAQTVPIIQYTRPIVDAIVNQTLILGVSSLLTTVDTFVSLSIESFNRNLYDHSNGGAYPHSSAHPWTPFQVLMSYVDPLADTLALSAVKQSADIIQQVAIQEGQSSLDAILYNNYAQKGTDLQLLYGNNLPVLQQLRVQWDPQNLLSLTGGWRF